MKLIDKLKNVFFEEVPDDEDEEELPQTFAKKIEEHPKIEVPPEVVYDIDLDFEVDFEDYGKEDQEEGEEKAKEEEGGDEDE